MYSSALTLNSQMFPHIDCESSDYYYETIEMKVLESGCYHLIGDNATDIYGYIYEDYFKPMSPGNNSFSQILRAYRGDQFELQTSLRIGINYVLAVTTFDQNMTGEFSIIATGPANIHFNRISEYICFFL